MKTPPQQSHYNEKSSRAISKSYCAVPRIKNDLFIQLSSLDATLITNRAREYLMQGVGRRVQILARCIHNIFTIFPLNRTGLLPKDSLCDLDINLHAFFVNIPGILDNLAWVHAFEKDLYGDPKEGKMGRNDIRLCGKKMQKHLGENCKRLLGSELFKQWYSEYCKNYRDALAHRIPLYVPPAMVADKDKEKWISLDKQLADFSLADKYDEIRREQENLGRSSPAFAHSFSENSSLIMIHAQILSDFETIKDIIDNFCKDYETSAATKGAANES